MHVHVGIAGDRWPELGGVSDEFRRSLALTVFLFYNRLSRQDFTDEMLRAALVSAIAGAREVDHVVCRARRRRAHGLAQLESARAGVRQGARACR